MPLKKSCKSSTIPVWLPESSLSHDVTRALRYQATYLVLQFKPIQLISVSELNQKTLILEKKSSRGGQLSSLRLETNEIGLVTRSPLGFSYERLHRVWTSHSLETILRTPNQ